MKLKEVIRIPVTEIYPNMGRLSQVSILKVERLLYSVEDHAHISPLVINEHGKLLDGYARLAAAILLDLNELPCVVIAGLTEKEQNVFSYEANAVQIEGIQIYDEELENMVKPWMKNQDTSELEPDGYQNGWPVWTG